MGLFGFGKHKSTPTPPPEPATFNQQPAPVAEPEGNEVFLDLNKGGILNLQKNDFLNLTKTGVNLTDIRVSAGWDVNHRGQDYDLDLCAYLLDGRNCVQDVVYYADKTAKGLQLDKDNLTGEGDGDDENIFVNFDKIDPTINRIVFGVVIYKAASKGQSFKHVRNAYVRMVDQSVHPECEICRYNLTEDGGSNTAVKFAEIVRTSEGWTFNAIGEYSKNTISSLKAAL